ncbi:cobalamin-dependent protein [Nocardia sp. NPDC005366]|uniref:B12-binding domain-containing radical SAM protein n=1 Tax=Nocardia sp. NPDC005366 TaxID=3156878 RepID=UPI0033ACC48F
MNAVPIPLTTTSPRELPTMPLRVWLVDLTYTQQGVSSETIPQAVAGLATYATTLMQFQHPVRIFKYPERLAAALAAEGAPEVIGFSNYVWNSNLARAFAARIKQSFPDTVTVFGGPHYPTVPAEQEQFLRDQLGGAVDFYVDREGEQAFADLLLTLAEHGRAHTHGRVAGVHSVEPHGRAHLPAPGPRLAALHAVPSPYLAGMLDEFIDGQLIPTIQTNRGCPFSCTFCVEGTRYHQKVAKKPADRVTSELRYIAERVVPLLADGRGRNELLITDSNFGMYPEDRQVCEAIASCQAEFGWPRYISVTTGKNRRERVLDAVSLVNGAMPLSGAVQSLDPEVLANVKRANIDTQALIDVALAAAARDTGAYSEVILGLPGDSKNAHFASLRGLLDGGFERLNMFQLTLLPGSDLWSRTSRAQHRMTTRFRVMPRCAGRYDVLGGIVSAAEIDEVCVALPTMSFTDYRHCRLMNLLVGVFYNGGAFSALVQGLRACGVPVFDWLTAIYDHVLSDIDRPDANVFTTLSAAFLADTDRQLWTDRSELEHHALTHLDRYLSGAEGVNLLYTYRAQAFSETFEQACQLARTAWTTVTATIGEPLAAEFATEATEYHRLRMVDVFTARAAAAHTQPARFDLESLITAPVPDRLGTYLLPVRDTRRFTLSDDQIRTVEGYLSKFGADPRGAGRMLTKLRMTDLLRRPRLTGSGLETGIVGENSSTSAHSDT